MNINNEYIKFAPYYQSVGIARNHFYTQFKLLKKYINKNDKKTVLDAACATGDVLNQLIIEYPQNDYYGSDLCNPLLNIAKQHIQSKADHLKQIDWFELSKYFEKDKFDLVCILGNSITHCQSYYEFEKVIIEVGGILNEKGKFLFDLRDWKLNKNKNSFNELYRDGKIQIKKGNVDFIYTTKYFLRDSKHILIHNIKNNTRETRIELPFLDISEAKIDEILNNYGFCKVKIIKNYDKYPFIIVESEKCK